MRRGVYRTCAWLASFVALVSCGSSDASAPGSDSSLSDATIDDARGDGVGTNAPPGDAAGDTSSGACGSRAGILDAKRSIDWTHAGVQGGIPARTTVCATIDASKFGSGTSDATSAIQAALDACPKGQTVSLSQGKFLVSTHVHVPSNVTLRGAGANKTILDAHGSDSGVVMIGNDWPSEDAFAHPTDVTAGATRGSTSLTLSASSGVAVGSLLVVSELNDPAFVTIHGGEGDCTWCGNPGETGTRARGQIVEVTAVSGTSVTIDPPLYSDYSHTPQVVPFIAASSAGVEDLQVYANKTGYHASFYLSSCKGCWVKGVESNYTDGDFVEVFFGLHDEVRDSYFSNAYSHGPGGTDSDIFLALKTSETLVENNIVERSHVAVMLNWGAAGNVVAYNYTTGAFFTNAATPGYGNPIAGGIDTHGAHPQFNLYEGNVLEVLAQDEIWGSSSHNTAFRNWAVGTSRVCSPTNDTRGTVDCSGSNGHWAFQSVPRLQHCP